MPRYIRSGENMLQDAIASVDDYKFEIEVSLAKQLGAKPLPFKGMDSKHACSTHHINTYTHSHLHIHREQGPSV